MSRVHKRAFVDNIANNRHKRPFFHFNCKLSSSKKKCRNNKRKAMMMPTAVLMPFIATLPPLERTLFKTCSRTFSRGSKLKPSMLPL